MYNPIVNGKICTALFLKNKVAMSSEKFWQNCVLKL